MVRNGEDLSNQSDADRDVASGMSVIPLPQQYNGHRHDALLSDSVVIGGSDTQGDVNCDGRGERH